MDFSEQQTTLSSHSDCGTPVGELHNPGRNVERYPDWGKQKPICDCESGQIVMTGRWPNTFQKSNQKVAIGYGLMLVFESAEGHLNGEQHHRHDELITEVAAMLGSDRCVLDSVQVEDDVANYVFFVESGELPDARFVGLSERYGPFMAWMTTHYDDDDSETVGYFVD